MLIRDFSQYQSRRSVADDKAGTADTAEGQAMDDLQPFSPIFEESALTKTDAQEHLLDCLFGDDVYDDTGNMTVGSTSVKAVLGRRNVQVAAVCALSIIACASFAAMSFCHTLKPVHPLQAAAAPIEPIALLSVDEMAKMPNQARKAVEKTNQAINGFEEGTKDVTNPALKDAALRPAVSADGSLDQGLIPVAYEPSGRPDPFAPLVGESSSANGPIGPDGMPIEKDVMDSLQYVGFIGDMNAKDKVAMIKVSDSVLGAKTLIKKMGETFTVDGKSLTLKSISKNELQLRVSGKTRSLALSTVQDGAAPSIAEDPSTGSGRNDLGNIKKIENGKTPDVKLQEP